MHTNTEADLCESQKTGRGEVKRGYVKCVTERQSRVRRRRQERLDVPVVPPLALNRQFRSNEWDGEGTRIRQTYQ